MPFAAYLQLGMQQAINRFLQGQIKHGQSLSLDFTGEDGGNEFADKVPDENALNGIETFERDDHRRAVLAKMSLRTRTFVELLRDPPDFMLAAVQERRARRTFAKETGLPLTPEANYVTATMIFEFMGVSQPQRTVIYTELRKFGHAG